MNSTITPTNYQVYRPVPQDIINKYYTGYKQIVLPQNIHIIQASEIQGLDDCVQFLQSKIRQYDNILLPNIEIPVDNNGWEIKDLKNKNIYFSENTIIRVKGLGKNKVSDNNTNDLSGGGITVWSCKNINFYNVQVKGNIHAIGQTGEYAHGFRIYDSENITIDTMKVWECYGDGFYIGTRDVGFCKNIILKNAFLDHCGRNTISITSCIGAKIESVLLANTFRTDPKCGVDIEPSSYYEIFQNIHFKNLGTWQSGLNGFNIYTRVNGSDTNEKHPYQFSIKLENWDNYYSYNGLGFNMLGFKMTGGIKQFYKHNIFGIVEIFNVNFHIENHNTDFVNAFLKEVKQANGITSPFKMVVENVKIIQPDSIIKIITDSTGLFEYKTNNNIDVIKVEGGKSIPKFLSQKVDKKTVDLTGSVGDSTITIRQRGMKYFSTYEIPTTTSHKVKELDFSQANGIEALLLFQMNNLSSLNVSGLKTLKRLILNNALKISNLEGLTDCNSINELIIHNNNELVNLSNIFNDTFWNLTTFKLNNCKKLTSLNLSRINRLYEFELVNCINFGSSIDVSTHPNLIKLKIIGCPNLTTIYASQEQMNKINKWVKDTNVNYVIK
ncbi:hypothetical protein CGC48_00725 [Capnocytophaga cynodegmi]|uniref:Right handed beta helix domain-containing protein n=1 Tax=Capnocytophaga cynodegmi TaxID=28189 RepID=A0A250E6A4_9FLAO|nr:hypothetical protein [Capnocytophaga cynodegmi]ATA67268.1 hypothetical protein CGC48_00725 [Capnocytophaga cynodegmi]